LIAWFSAGKLLEDPDKFGFAGIPMNLNTAFHALAAAFVIVSRTDGVGAGAGESGDFFSQKVHPLLEAKCFGCHGEPKDREAELDMRTRAGLLKGGESGKPALVAGQPNQSPMFKAVLRQGKLKMPPKERNKLELEEIEIIRQWITDGALWSEPKEGKPKWALKPEDIWAFQPVARHSRTASSQSDSRVENSIDAFIRSKLEEKKLRPAPRADRATLIRRATFDLIGLPPTPEEVDAFLKDKSPGAFDKVIERLLASPRYGEHWGRHWLDVVRYADTDGFSNDYERPNAWRYRDYIIRSFNTDKPYDQFIIEQVAGDELKPQDPEKVIATGMLRMGPWEQTAMSVAAVTRQQFLDDVTHNVSATFLGLTVGCARCHDHKFDPIPTKDYYRLQSVYAPVQFEARPTPFLPEENTGDFKREAARVQLSLTNLHARLNEIAHKHERAVKAFLKEKGYAALKEVPASLRPMRELGLTPADMSIEKVLRKRVDYCDRELSRYQPVAFNVSSRGLQPPTPTPALHILIGGSLESPGETVAPGVLTAVVSHGQVDYSPEAESVIPQTDSARRLALAKWMASAENPLTARVMVNRIWQGHFGEGLVGTPNNFGKMGKRPAHPELLDWLAQYFIGHGWSVKEMHRLIMRSETYQQSAAPADPAAVRLADPERKLWSHFLPRRLTAEELRDSMLLVSGELSTTMGGPPVFPEINLEAALQPRHIMGSLAPPYKPSPTREQRNRRSIYTVQIRTLMNPLLQVFNQPAPDFSCERRDATTITPQVFALFNSQNAHDLALALADRIQKLASSRTGQIEAAFRLAYGRSPGRQEKELCLKHLTRMTAHHRATTPQKFEFPRKVVQPMIEELTGDPFEFEEDWDMSSYQYNLQPTEVSPETRALADLCLVLLNANEFVYVY
jgi:hypothetical protein